MTVEIFAIDDETVTLRFGRILQAIRGLLG